MNFFTKLKYVIFVILVMLLKSISMKSKIPLMNKISVFFLVFNGNIYSIVYINTALFSGIVVSIDLFINVSSCQCSRCSCLQ